MDEIRQRAVLLHVVSMNRSLIYNVYPSDEALGRDCRIDWARRVMCAWNFA